MQEAAEKIRGGYSGAGKDRGSGGVREGGARQWWLRGGLSLGILVNEDIRPKPLGYGASGPTRFIIEGMNKDSLSPSTLLN